MFSNTKRNAIVLLCAATLIASACGSGSSSGVDTVQAQDSSVDAASSSQANEPAGDDGGDDAFESPLADLLGIPLSSDDDMSEFFSELQRNAELKISECMLAQGFEYQAVDYGVLGALDADIDFESEAFAKEYGFGIASNPIEESFEAFQAIEDPNMALLEKLSPGEAEAYQTALSGELPDFDSTSPAAFEPGGCQGQAYDEVFSFGRIFDEFADELETVEQQYEADPRIVQATAGWGDCMTEAGYRYADVEGAEDDFRRRMSAITDNPDAYEDVDGAEVVGDVEVEVVGPGTEDVFSFGPGTLRPEFQERVDALAVEERAVAVASWACSEPLRSIEDEVRIEYEQRFVDQNGAAISAALDE